MDNINIAFASLQLLTLPIVLSEFSVALCAMQYKLSYFDIVCTVKLFQKLLTFIRYSIRVMHSHFVLPCSSSDQLMVNRFIFVWELKPFLLSIY